MDLRWGFDYAPTSYTSYQCPEYTNMIDCKISTIGVDMESPVDWISEDLQEIIALDSNPSETVFDPEKDCKETPAFQQILSDLYHTASKVENKDVFINEELHSHATLAKAASENWPYTTPFHSSESNNLTLRAAIVETTTQHQECINQPKQILPSIVGTEPAEQNFRMYSIFNFDSEPMDAVHTVASNLQNFIPLLERMSTSNATESFSCSSPLTNDEDIISVTASLKSESSPKSDNKLEIHHQTPKKKRCLESLSTVSAPSPSAQVTIAIPGQMSPILSLEQVESTQSETSTELGPLCKALGIISSDLEQTVLPEGRIKLPREALINGIVFELYAHWRQSKSPRRTLVRFLSLYFDIQFLDESNPTVVDRLFRRVIAPLLSQRSDLIKSCGVSITRQPSGGSQLKARKGMDSLTEFDSAVFIIPEFVTEPCRRTNCNRSTGTPVQKDRRMPTKERKPPKPTQGQQLLELQARFDAFRLIQRKHNLAFLRQLNRLQTKLNKLTDHLSRRLHSAGRRASLNLSN